MGYFNPPDPFEEAEYDEQQRLEDMLEPEERAQMEEERSERARRRISDSRKGRNA